MRKIKQYQTSIHLEENLLSVEQKGLREDIENEVSENKKCNTCLIDKPLLNFRLRTIRRGVKGLFYDAKCKDCYARVRGTKEIGKLKFAKVLFNKNFRACTFCKKIQPLSEYYTNKAAHNGIDYRCKNCTSQRKKNIKKQR